MNILMLDPATLVPYEKNTKAHPPEQVEAIAESIKNFGFDQPIVVDANRVIIKGHGRRLAALHLHLKKVPVLVREHISENDARFLRETDNTLQSVEWDRQNLATELMTLKEAGLLATTLFKEDEIPDLQKFQLVVKSNKFDLVTRHECPKCHYKW